MIPKVVVMISHIIMRAKLPIGKPKYVADDKAGQPMLNFAFAKS